MPDFLELIIKDVGPEIYSNDVKVDLTGVQSCGAARLEIGHRRPGWDARQEMKWHGVFLGVRTMESTCSFAWMTADEALAVGVSLINAANKLRDGVEE